MEKRHYLPVMFNEADLDAMQAIHAQIDPAGHFEPGQDVPGFVSSHESEDNYNETSQH